jgi:hypothetical protein
VTGNNRRPDRLSLFPPGGALTLEGLDGSDTSNRAPDTHRLLADLRSSEPVS